MVKESKIIKVRYWLSEEELEASFNYIMADGWELINVTVFRGEAIATFVRDKVE